MSEHQHPGEPVVAHLERSRRRVPAWKLVAAALVLAALVWIVMKQAF